ncbi:MAG TPA: hypothetical protein VF461_23030 [Gemmatimonadaceae bacterium]
MSRALRLGLATIMAVGAMLALASVSAAPFRANALPEARLRVAFSARPERIETCRTPSESELANLPAHMRQGVVCEGTTATYRLEVRHDDSLVATALLRGGGLRHDRRLYALRELSVPSGHSTIDVRLVRVDSVVARPARESHESDDHTRIGEDAFARDEDEHRRTVADEVPPLLTLRDTLTLRPREVLLVTYDQASHRLRTVRGAP